MKICKCCKATKPLSAYAKDATKKDGHVNKCKQCRNVDSQRRYTAKREEIAAKKLVHRSANRSLAREYAAKWAQENPEQRAATRAAYRARKQGAAGTHSAQDILALIRLQRGKCPVCKASIAGGYHVDHVMPLALGGDNDKTNLQLLCPPCNLSKAAKHPIEHARQLGRLL